MLSLLAVVTTLALIVIAVMVKDISKASTGTRSAALSTPAPTASAHTTRSASLSVSPRRKPTRHVPRIADTSSGLSYRLLSSPWRRGCPNALNTPMFSWSAGESAVAGQVSVAGYATDWYGSACSGQLQQQFEYSGAADLEPTAMSLVDALDMAYYSGLPHNRTIENISPLEVSGHQAWEVTFLMTYPDAAGQGLAWTSEAGAVVVVDRGAAQAPAVFYASVPSNLGTSAVSTLIGSLRLG